MVFHSNSNMSRYLHISLNSIKVHAFQSIQKLYIKSKFWKKMRITIFRKKMHGLRRTEILHDFETEITIYNKKFKKIIEHTTFGKEFFLIN